VNEQILDDAKYKYLFTVDAMNELVKQGVSYRDAYRQVGNAVEAGTFERPNLEGGLEQLYTHEGSMGNLCLPEIKAQMQLVLDRF
jgi:argininosuccinate lyase